MQHLIKIICLLILSTSFAIAQDNSGNDVIINISNLENNDGKVYVALYNSEGAFLNKVYRANFTNIENKKCSIVFKDIPNGVFAVSMFHDENDNNKMDTGVFGIPKEDYGCSNNAKGFMGPPKWEDAKFTINNESVTHNIKL